MRKFGRPEPAQVVALARQLGLDHLGAELGHERAAERAGHDLRQLEHANATQRQGAFGHGERAALYQKRRLHPVTVDAGPP